MRARMGPAGLPLQPNLLVCEQSFKPFADALTGAGFALAEENQESFPLVLLLPPRQREESRALLARALQRAAPGGVVMACMLNNEGARSGEADMQRLAGSVNSLSKNKCRVFWTTTGPEAMDTALVEQWAALDAPRLIAEGRFMSRPGLFAWDRIDVASALLARCLPTELSGHGADLGAGFGYLSAEVLARCPGVTTLDLYEAEARALDLARANLKRQSRQPRQHLEGAALNFFWHDVTTGLGQPARYDFIVSNPPFHQGRADQPEMGRAFILAAAAALLPDGRLWLVANRHLPYEEVLRKNFRKVRTVTEEHNFKVFEAIQGTMKART
ncbi:MAG: class I SAM-dependent methyltransferase [Betaproteobacteria bacterium]|nr:class I SAM-dependent methyltransferase [Betaproteobacteria bacterium]